MKSNVRASKEKQDEKSQRWEAGKTATKRSGTAPTQWDRDVVFLPKGNRREEQEMKRVKEEKTN